MEKSPAEQSLDKLFEGLPVDEASAATTARCLVELAYFETRWGRNHLKLSATALSRALQCVAPQALEIPPPFNKLMRDELSNFGQKIKNAKHTPFKYFQDRIIDADLPFSIFCKETKRRIFRFFAEPLKNQIRDCGWAVAPNRLETYHHILRTLARHCESLVCLTGADDMASLRASLDLAKSQCEALKEQLERLAPSEDGSGLENKYKKALAEAAQLSAQIQKRLQGQKT